MTRRLRLFRQYLHQPYSFFLDHNTADLSKGILTEVDLVVSGVLRAAMDVLARGAVVMAILTFLLVRDPLLAITAAAILIVIYGAIYAFVRPRLMKYGNELGPNNQKRFQATSEAFGAIKELKILGRESTFEQTFQRAAHRFAWSQAAKDILMLVPKHALEAVAFGLMILWILSLLLRGEGVATILPLVSVYGFAAYRLLPSLQVVFSGVAQIRYYGHTVDTLHGDMRNMKDWASIHDEQLGNDNRSQLQFHDNLTLHEASFWYPSSSAPVLHEISIEIAKNTTIGFVGTTGCGKTTLVDLVMGLLEPTSGEIRVDGEPIDCTQRAWQRSFGYVPQQIFLSDDSVAANIAFGVPAMPAIRRRSSGPRVLRTCTTSSSPSCPMDMKPTWESGAFDSRAVNVSAWASRERSTTIQ